MDRGTFLMEGNWDFWMTLATLATVLVGVVAFVYTQRRDRSRDDKDAGHASEKLESMEKTLDEHSKADDKHFNRIYDELKDLSSKVSEVLGYMRGQRDKD